VGGDQPDAGGVRGDPLPVELVRHAGHPELAPLFCVGDARYFREVEAEAELLRPTTLAAGDDRCRFTIRFEENG
jgi:hypothetical protein